MYTAFDTIAKKLKIKPKYINAYKEFYEADHELRNILNFLADIDYEKYNLHIYASNIYRLNQKVKIYFYVNTEDLKPSGIKGYLRYSFKRKTYKIHLGSFVYEAENLNDVLNYFMQIYKDVILEVTKGISENLLAIDLGTLNPIAAVKIEDSKFIGFSYEGLQDLFYIPEANLVAVYNEYLMTRDLLGALRKHKEKLFYTEYQGKQYNVFTLYKILYENFIQNHLKKDDILLIGSVVYKDTLINVKKKARYSELTFEEFKKFITFARLNAIKIYLLNFLDEAQINWLPVEEQHTSRYFLGTRVYPSKELMGLYVKLGNKLVFTNKDIIAALNMLFSVNRDIENYYIEKFTRNDTHTYIDEIRHLNYELNLQNPNVNLNCMAI